MLPDSQAVPPAPLKPGRHWPSYGWNLSNQSSADQPLGGALLYFFLKQTPEDLAKTWLPPPKLGDRAVIRYPIKQIRFQIPAQRHIRLDPLLNLTLGGDYVQKAYQQIFHQHHRVDVCSLIPLAIQVSRFLIYKFKIQYRIQFPQKWPFGTRFSIITMCSFNYIFPPPMSSFYYSFLSGQIFCQQLLCAPKASCVLAEPLGRFSYTVTSNTCISQSDMIRQYNVARLPSCLMYKEKAREIACTKLSYMPPMATGTMHGINNAIVPRKSFILLSYFNHIVAILYLYCDYYCHIIYIF